MLLMLLLPIFSQTVKAVDTHKGCPCDCDEILYDNSDSGFGYDGILVTRKDSHCFEMDILITGCGGRTVTGFSFSFPHDPDDPCLNQDWEIRDGNTNAYLGTYNPINVNPTFGNFRPPVQPCETNEYKYIICPDDMYECDWAAFNIFIQFHFAEGDPPCPEIYSGVIMASWMDVSNNSSKKFSVNSTSEYIRINQINESFDDAVLEIVDIFGKVVKQIKLNVNETIIKTDDLITGKYYCILKKKGNISEIFNYTVVK
jgi:hypothetical protein